MNGGPLGYERWHVRNWDNVQTRKDVQILKMFLVLPAATAAFQEWYFRVREKEHLHHTMVQTDGSSWVSDLRDVPVSPSMDATLSAALRRGKSRSRIAQQKNLMSRLSTEPFFLIFTPG